MEDIQLNDKFFSIYLGENTIQTRIRELAEQINRDYAEKSPVIIPILNGSFLFAADLVRWLNINPEIHFARTSSYGNKMHGSEQVRLVLDLEIDITGRPLIIVEDVVDTGRTYSFLFNHFAQKKPASISLVTLLFKPDVFNGETKPEYIGFSIPPDFVVGYGMDYAQRGRELRSIYKLRE